MEKMPTYEELNQRVRGLEVELHKLKRIVPVCPSCKKIRDDEKFWHLIEQYIHGQDNIKDMSCNLCSGCADVLSEVLAEI